MNHKKLIPILFATFLLVPGIIHADEIGDMKVAINDMVMKVIAKYETRIQSLETENTALKAELARLKWVESVAPVLPAVANIPSGITTGMTKTEIYAVVMKSINANIANILTENSLDGSGVIGLFEFIEPNAVFISIDDGKNPQEVTAFKTKILYTFDNNLSLTKVGLFDIDYVSQKYKTVFGSNPYTKSVRTRIINPLYKGKLFDITANNTGSMVMSTTSNIISGEVTFAQIKTAYDKNKNLDVLKLSESYIVKNPTDIEVLRMRYRSFHFISKYNEALAEIKKIEDIQWANMDKLFACDAANIGRITKKKDVTDHYSAICKKK